jgi:uncharacterized protein YegP (UPF0339 family)
MAKFVVTKRQNGEFQFNLKAGNGEIILTSEGYAARAGCNTGIESVRKNASDDSKFDQKVSKDNRFYFNLKATNGQIIGVSEMYNTEAAREQGIESVKKNAPAADVADESQ